jgi:hypothetical protein
VHGDSVRRRRFAARALAVTAAVAACVGAALTASAATETKPYHATIDGASSISVAAGSSFTADIAIVNDSGHPLGSANIVIPGAFDVGPVDPLVAVPSGKTWLDAVESPQNTIQLRNPGPAQTNALAQGESATVTTPMRAPCPVTSPRTYALDTQAKQSNDFNGVGNDLFLPDADEPAIVVTGSCHLAVSIVTADGLDPAPDSSDPAVADEFTIDVDLLDGAGNPMTLASALPVTVCEGGAGAFRGSVTPTPAGCFTTAIAAGSSEVQVPGVTYSQAENNVTVTASTTTVGIQPGSTLLSVVVSKGRIGPTETAGTTCVDNDTGPREVCVQVILPTAAGETINLATRPCAGLVGSCVANQLGEAIGDFTFPATAAARMVLEYDKLLKVSTKITLFFDDLKGGGPVVLVKCLKGGVVPAGKTGCELKRGKNPAGDTVFEILFRADPRLFGG